MIFMEKKYIETLLAQIREKRARECVRLEIAGHIAEQKACYMADGIPEEQAEAQAVADMGDPVETGTALDQIHRPKPAWGMLAIIAILCAAGVILQYAAYICNPDAQTGSYYFQKQCCYAVLGFCMLCMVYLADYTRIAKYSRYLCTAILLLLCLAAGSNSLLFPRLYTHGYLNIRFLGANFPPLDIPGLDFLDFAFAGWISLEVFFYLYLPVYGAMLYSYRSCRIWQLWKVCIYTLLPIVLALQLTRTVVFLNVTVILLLMLGMAIFKGWFLLPFPASGMYSRTRQARSNQYRRLLCLVCIGAVIIIGIVCLLLPITMCDYQYIRIQAWLHPEDFSHTQGYVDHIIRNVLSSSQLIGSGTKHPIEGYLPEYATDHILTYAIGKFGVLAAAALILLIVMFGAKLLHLSVHQKNQLGMIMGYGCSLAFIIQSAEYILVNLSLLPAGSMYLPLISFGGSGMLQTCILLGILLSIYRYENVVPDPKTGFFARIFY